MDLSAFVGIWVGLHIQIAKLSGNPELAITDADGKAFLNSLQNVLRHYPISASQQALDWAAFIMCASFIYAPRAAAIHARRNRPPEEARPSATVFHFSQGGVGGGTRPDFAAPPPPPPPTVDVEPEITA